jgi:hypothetical protein
MADQAWIDQTNIIVAASADPQARLDQTSLLVVWGEALPEEGGDRTNDLMWLDTGIPTTLGNTNTILQQALVLTAGEEVTEGHLVTIYDDAGTTKIRKANAATAGRQSTIAVVLSNTTVGNPAPVWLLPGAMVDVYFGAAPAASSNGSPVYLSTSDGQGTLVPPSGSGEVIIRVGILFGGDGSDTSPEVIFRPQFITEIT